MSISSDWSGSFINWFTQIVALHYSNIHISALFHSSSSWMATGSTLPYSGTPAGRGSFTSLPGSRFTPFMDASSSVIFTHYEGGTFKVQH